jgi:hypothetical protein
MFMKSTSLVQPAAVVACVVIAAVAVGQPSAEARPPSKNAAPTSLLKLPAAPPNATAIVGAKHLAVQEKIKLVTPTGPAAGSDVQAPFTLGPRTPIAGSNGSVTFTATALVNPERNESYMRPESSIGIVLHGRASFRYLVDCIASSDAPVEMSAFDISGSVARGTSTVSSSNHHATLVIPKRAADGVLAIDVKAHTYWTLGSCEITPVR